MLGVVVMVKNSKSSMSLHSIMPKMLPIGTVFQQQGMKDFQRAGMMETG